MPSATAQFEVRAAKRKQKSEATTTTNTVAERCEAQLARIPSAKTAAASLEALGRVALDTKGCGDVECYAEALRRLQAQLVNYRANFTAPAHDEDEEIVLLAKTAQALAIAGCADEAMFSALADAVRASLAARAPTKSACEVARAGLGLAAVSAAHGVWAALSKRSGSKGSSSGACEPWADDALEALWRDAASQKKVRASVCEGDDAWPPSFADETKPLVIDLGCGVGASTLTYALVTTEYNVIGSSAHAHTLAYARGVAARRGLTARCAFVSREASEVLQWARHAYPGSVEAVLIQFPTPYALGDDARVKSKFLANSKVLGLAAKLQPRLVYFASNVEDVAVTMRADYARIAGENAEAVLDQGDATADTDRAATMPPRTQKWVASGGARAEGPGWLAASPLPRRVRSETEAHHELIRWPIHRCAFRHKQRPQETAVNSAVNSAEKPASKKRPRKTSNSA